MQTRYNLSISLFSEHPWRASPIQGYNEHSLYYRFQRRVRAPEDLDILLCRR